MRLGWRLAALAAVFLAAFVVLTLQLWLLQVARGEEYDVAAARQQIKIVDSPAPRGEIRDRNGELLAATRAASAIVVDRSLVPVEREREVIERLATLLDLPVAAVETLFSEAGSGGRVVVGEDVASTDALFVREHAEEFPGVAIEELPVRTYPQRTAAAHVIGYIGSPDARDLERPGIRPDDVVGKFGVEREYDELLRGARGLVKYRVDAGRNILSVEGRERAEPGATVVLNLDLGAQRALEQSLSNALALARAEGELAVRAAGLVMDPRDGSIQAMASIPSFDPADFVGGLTRREWDLQKNLGAFNNFAIQGLYPPASTFKSVAFVMALEDGIYPEEAAAASPEAGFFCSGLVEFRLGDDSQQTFRDWKPEGHGLVDLHGALEQSCDLYFWSIALRVWSESGARGDLYDEAQIQEWARAMGYGAESSIDLPFEQAGLVPDREWFERAQRESPGRVRSGSTWLGGDVMNVVIGQGDVLATPLQVANAYASLVNGGTVWRPRIVDRVVDGEGNEVFVNQPRELGIYELSPSTIAFVREDLRRVVNGDSGTARVAFSTLPAGIRNQIGGKTGTAEIDKSKDINTAWFVGVAPIDDPQHVVAIVVDGGGSGGRIAAPAARQVFEYLLQGQEVGDEIIPGEEAD